LPGLILKATDSTQTHSFEAISIRKSNAPVYLNKTLSPIKITKKGFFKNKTYFEGDKLNLEYLNYDQKNHMSISKEVLYIYKQRTGWNIISKNKPLEFE